MHRQNYEAIAAILCEEYKCLGYETVLSKMSSARHKTRSIANRLANYFATENENFDKNKFLEACNMGGLNGFVNNEGYIIKS